MKIRVLKQVSLALAVCFLLSVFTPLPVKAAAPDVILTLSPQSLTQSDSEQTVSMNLKLNTTGLSGAYNFGFILKKSNDIPVKTIPGSIYDEGKQVYATIGFSTENAESDGYVDLGNIVYTVPANAVGSYILNLSEMGVQKQGSSTKLLTGGVAQTTLVIAEAPAAGYTASLTGPAAATVGDALTYRLTVDKTFAAAKVTVKYDASRLTYNGTYPAQNGVITVIDYGADKTGYTLPFTAAADGTATVELTAAAFGTGAEAETSDLKTADLENAAVTTVINKVSHSIALPQGISGAASVKHNEPYSFTVKNYQPDFYDYKLETTMGSQPITLTIGENGTCSIPAVTGDLKIELTQTPKAFPVKVEGISGVSAADAIYDTDYIYSLPGAPEHYENRLVSVTVGGADYEVSAQDGKLTIPGKDITGQIVITLERVQTEFPVTVTGSGSADVKAYDDYTTANTDYALTLDPVKPYVYEVTATVGGKSVAVAQSGNTYTIENPAGAVVFTVAKSLGGTFHAEEYVRMDGNTVWLIQYEAAKLPSQTYTYEGEKMFWSENYTAYCLLTIGGTKPTLTADDFGVTNGAAGEIPYTGDVNITGKVDANDAQLAYNIYNAQYSSFTENVTMEKFLRADVTGDGVVDTADASAIIRTAYGQ